jgi:hypothetical protein
MDDVTASKIKALEDELAELKAHLNKPAPEVKKTGWDRAKIGEYYCAIDGIEVNTTFENRNIVDLKCYETANYFSSKELAERVKFEQDLFRKLRRFADENNEPIDWKCAGSNKFEIFYDYANSMLKFNALYRHRSQGVVYFSSDDIALKAIQAFKDDLLRYYTTNK